MIGLLGSKPIIPLFGSLFDPSLMMDRMGMKRCEGDDPMEYVVDAVCTITWQAEGTWRTSLWWLYESGPQLFPDRHEPSHSRCLAKAMDSCDDPAIHQWCFGGCSFCPRIGLVFGEVRLCIVIDIDFGYVARHRQQKEC